MKTSFYKEVITLRETQVKIFDDYNVDAINEMNEFMWNKNVIDVKMNTVVAVTGQFFTRYLVLYTD